MFETYPFQNENILVEMKLLPLSYLLILLLPLLNIVPVYMFVTMSTCLRASCRKRILRAHACIVANGHPQFSRAWIFREWPKSSKVIHVYKSWKRADRRVVDLRLTLFSALNYSYRCREKWHGSVGQMLDNCARLCT